MRLTIDEYDEFSRALPILLELQKHDYQAYFVGGSVRDALLGQKVNDVDIATSAQPDEIKAIFSRTVDVGIEHGTVLVLWEDQSYEITTFRSESQYSDYRRPESVTFVRSLKEDLNRRDFTINAFALDIDGNVYDYFKGQEDLAKGLVRAVGDPEARIKEDALRMMRAVRFAGQLGFEIEENTMKSIHQHHDLLHHIAVERVYVEWVKLLCSQWRSYGLRAIISTKLYESLPMLADKKMALISLVNKDGKLTNDCQVWAALAYLIQYYLPKNQKLDLRQFLKEWKASNQVVEDTSLLVEGLTYRITHQQLLTNELLFKLGEKLAVGVEELIQFLFDKEKLAADRQSTYKNYQALPIKSKQEIQINGHQLMEEFDKKPGKWLGELNQVIQKAIIDGKLENTSQAILEFAKDLHANHS